MEAYERVISALHDSKVFAARHAEAELEHTELPEETSKELRARARVAHDEILRARDIGAFLLSEDALRRLMQYKQEEDEAQRANTWFDYLEADWAATDTCPKDIIQIAKRDLRAG